MPDEGFRLAPEAATAGFRLRSFETVGSTSAEALALARDGEGGPLWAVSSHQTAGRGRRGSAWETPRGNLAASLLRVVDLPSPVVATLGFVAGLALDEALRLCCGPAIRTAVALDGARAGGGSPDRFALKWPNDVLVDGAKLAGILLETEVVGASRAVVVGIGVNVATAPTGLPYRTTSLSALGVSVSAEALFEALSGAWIAVERVWDEGRGFAAVRRLWLERAAGLGSPVAVRLGAEVVRGTFETIDDQGQLVVRTDAGHARAVAAGDVHFGVAASVR